MLIIGQSTNISICKKDNQLTDLNDGRIQMLRVSSKAFKAPTTPVVRKATGTRLKQY